MIADRRYRAGLALLMLSSVALMFAAVVAMVLAATTVLLPDDADYLGLDTAQLCAINSCRILHFLSHDRVAFGSGIAAVAILYSWLVAAPLRAGHPWAWWTMVASAVVGFGSFLTFAIYGYLDVWHGVTSVILLIVFSIGLWLTFHGLQRPRDLSWLRRPPESAPLRSAFGMGRALLLVGSLGGIATGFSILLIGLTIVFVPQDITFFQQSAAGIRSVNPRLVPLIVHDRVEFGAGTAAAGMIAGAAIWKGLSNSGRGLWWALLLATLIGYVSNIVAHFANGYSDTVHLLPVYAGFLINVTGLALLHVAISRRRA